MALTGVGVGRCGATRFEEGKERVEDDSEGWCRLVGENGWALLLPPTGRGAGNWLTILLSPEWSLFFNLLLLVEKLFWSADNGCERAAEGVEMAEYWRSESIHAYNMLQLVLEKMIRAEWVKWLKSSDVKHSEINRTIANCYLQHLLYLPQSLEVDSWGEQEQLPHPEMA